MISIVNSLLAEIVGYLFHGCSSKAQSLLLILDEGYLLMAAPPDLEHGVAPLGPPAPTQPWLRVTRLVAAPSLGGGLLLRPAAAPGLRRGGVGYTKKLYKKDLHNPDNHDGMITHLESDILECEVR